MSDAPASAYAHCEDVVRAEDPDRHLSALFAPAALRPHLHALSAFSVEVSRIRGAVSAPLPGEIRLQWWRDALAGETRGDLASHPVAAALDDTICRFDLPRTAFGALLDARVFDLYDDPMPSVADLEGYLGETASAPIRLAALVLADGADPGPADAAGHAGVAYGIAGLLRALPWHAREGRLYVPKEVLDRYGVTREDVVTGRGGPGFLQALTDLRKLARDHLSRAAAVPVPATIRSALLPGALVPGYLHDMEAPGYDPFRTVIEVPRWRKIATLWWAANRRGNSPIRLRLG